MRKERHNIVHVILDFWSTFFFVSIGLFFFFVTVVSKVVN